MIKKWVLFCSLIFPAASIHAYDAVLKAVKGEVSVRPANTVKFKAAKKGLKLGSNDQIRTGAAGLVQVAFKSGAMVLVKEKSQFWLKTDRRGDFLSFVRGEFLIGLKHKLKAGQKFTVKTPACVAAVRGTVFWGLSDERQASTYACFTGVIDVAAQGKTVSLAPGQKLRVNYGAEPSRPGPAGIAPAYVKTFAIDDSLGGVDEILNSESK